MPIYALNRLQICVIDENITNIDAEKINEIQIPIGYL